MSDRLTSEEITRKTKAFDDACRLVWGWLDNWPLDVECSRKAQGDLTERIAAAIAGRDKVNYRQRLRRVK